MNKCKELYETDTGVWRLNTRTNQMFVITKALQHCELVDRLYSAKRIGVEGIKDGAMDRKPWRTQVN